MLPLGLVDLHDHGRRVQRVHFTWRSEGEVYQMGSQGLQSHTRTPWEGAAFDRLVLHQGPDSITKVSMWPRIARGRSS
jgi:hypothetical protein